MDNDNNQNSDKHLSNSYYVPHGCVYYLQSWWSSFSVFSSIIWVGKLRQAYVRNLGLSAFKLYAFKDLIFANLFLEMLIGSW